MVDGIQPGATRAMEGLGVTYVTEPKLHYNIT